MSKRSCGAEAKFPQADGAAEEASFDAMTKPLAVKVGLDHLPGLPWGGDPPPRGLPRLRGR